MDIFNCYPGYEIFGVFQCTDPNGKARKGENFRNQLNVPDLSNVIISDPREYEDEEGNKGTEVDIQIQYQNEGQGAVKIIFDAIEGTPEQDVEFEIGINNTTLATGGIFRGDLRQVGSGGG